VVRQPREIMIRENRIIIMFLGILTVIAVGLVLYQVRSIILPFALAVFLGYILNPLIQYFEDRKVPTILAITLGLVITFLVLNFFGVLVYTSIRSFASEFPQYESRLTTIFEQALRFLNIPVEVFRKDNSAQGGLQWLNSIRELSLHKLVLSTLGSIVNFMSNSLLVLLFLLFIFIGRNQLALKVQLAFKPETAVKISVILKNINRQIQKYLIAKTFISLATGLLFTVILMFFDIPFAMIWGILTFMLNFIPNIGSIIATILPLAMGLIQFKSVTTFLWLALCLVAVQVVIGNFIDPKVVGDSLNLSPLVVLFSLMFWGWLWGIIGMFLAVPLMVVIKIVFENIESLRFLSVMMSAR
jgi:AI-2 transport protein TqsA